MKGLGEKKSPTAGPYAGFYFYYYLKVLLL